jgi:hypothetical protein
MEAHMVTDTVLWGLMAAAIAFVWWGCHNTRQGSKAREQVFEHTKLDRAA